LQRGRQLSSLDDTVTGGRPYHTYGTGDLGRTLTDLKVTSGRPLRDYTIFKYQCITPLNNSVYLTDGKAITRDRLAELLNEGLAREYQAIIAYVVFSQVLKGAEYMNIADQLETHAQQELQHALIISRQIDYLGKMPTVSPKPVKVSDDPKEMLKFDLDNENETIRNYRERVRQCEAIGEFALAEQIRQILVQEQDHQIDLATALGIDVPNVR
jgi:bacterioferritin